MPLPLTWDQMPLTAAQQTLMQNLIAWGATDQSVAPPLTYSQVKNIRAWLASNSALVGPALSSMTAAVQFYQSQNAAAFEAANP